MLTFKMIRVIELGLFKIAIIHLVKKSSILIRLVSMYVATKYKQKSILSKMEPEVTEILPL